MNRSTIILLAAASLLEPLRGQNPAAQARQTLRQILDQDRTWSRIHAAEALVAEGEGETVRRAFEAEAATADSSPFRVGVWRGLANTAPTAVDRSQWAAKVEATIVRPGDPERLDAIETLCRLRVRGASPTLAALKKMTATDPEGDALLSWWALAFAGEPGALDHIVASLSSHDPLARERAAYALRWLEAKETTVHEALARSADAEPDGSTAYPYVLSAALRLHADAARTGEWRKGLEKILAHGSGEARYEACQALMLGYSPSDFARLQPLLGDADPDARIGAAWAILHIERMARPSGLFDHSEMKRVDLKGLKIWLGKPVLVASQISWATSWPGEDGRIKTEYVHPFPVLGKFPRGELIAGYSLVPDVDDDPVMLSGYQISADGGIHWDRRQSVLSQQPAVFEADGPDALLAIPYNLIERTPGDEHNFLGPTYLFEKGGRKMCMQPDGAQVRDWPWPIDAYYSSQPRENWPTRLSLGGTLLSYHGRLLLTGTAGAKGEAKDYHNVLLVSDDGGHVWRYYATVAGPDPALATANPHYEGPNETAITELADGDLMAVFRVGSGRAWHLRRSYSHDGGRSWGRTDILPAFSVYPQLVRAANGVIALATGRPGVDLWLSADPRGTAWQRINVAAFNNACAADATYCIYFFGSGQDEKSQTDSYTKLIEVAPNRLLLIYDRDPVIRPPEQPPAGPWDLTRVLLLPIELERD